MSRYLKKATKKNRRFTPEQIVEIRAAISDRSKNPRKAVSIANVAKSHGVSRVTIRQIINGETYKELL